MTLDELDRLAAEKLMGFTEDEWHTHPCGCPTDWQPTRNISQAWELLEKMREQGWFSSTTELSLDKGKPNWCWGLIYKKDGSTRYAEGRGPAPEAIVRACLKAKGIEL